MLLIIAVCLSIDAFSLALAYGTLGFSKKEILKLSLIVGIYHFVMPIIGLYSGRLILKILPISEYDLAFLVFLIIGLNMIIDSFSKKEIKKISIHEYFLFGLAVSIDSFSVGISLKIITNNYLLAPFVFSVISGLFTYLGLILGKRIKEIIGKIASLIGGVILIILGFLYLI